MFKELLEESKGEGCTSLLLKESEVIGYPVKLRLTMVALLQAAETVAEEYGGAGNWTLGIHMQNKVQSADLYNECWLRVPLYGVTNLKPGYGTLATKLDGPTTKHRVRWKGLYVCAYLNLSKELNNVTSRT